MSMTPSGAHAATSPVVAALLRTIVVIMAWAIASPPLSGAELPSDDHLAEALSLRAPLF